MNEAKNARSFALEPRTTYGPSPTGARGTIIRSDGDIDPVKAEGKHQTRVNSVAGGLVNKKDPEVQQKKRHFSKEYAGS